VDIVGEAMLGLIGGGWGAGEGGIVPTLLFHVLLSIHVETVRITVRVRFAII
jgi:hypothetical protein